MKATEQWIAEQQHILPDCEWQHITFTMPDKLWPAFNLNWPLLNQLFACAAYTLLKWAEKMGMPIESVQEATGLSEDDLAQICH